MPSRQSGKENRSGKTELSSSNSDIDLSVDQSVSDTPQRGRTSIIEELDVKSNRRQSVMLGDFTEDNPPKGFSVELTPDPSPAGSVSTEVITVETPKGYKLVLLIANKGVRKMRVKVRQLQ